MSTNAVLCVTDSQTTVRLTKYRCKPTLMLGFLQQVIDTVGVKTLQALVDSLVTLGFEVDSQADKQRAVYQAPFSPAQMQTASTVNWAWLLDLSAQTISYWDVTACLDGLEQTVANAPESPLTYLDWVGASEKKTLHDSFLENQQALTKLGMTIANF